jgi:hypothetical protein
MPMTATKLDPTDYMAAWEAMLECRENIPAMDALWAQIGTVAMRHYTVAIAEGAMKAWHKMDGAHTIAVPYDWEYLPEYLRRIPEWGLEAATLPTDLKPEYFREAGE